jgi:outer membrane biosynthesis protein TonB
MLMKFMKYDELLLQSILDQIARKRQTADQTAWVQIPPGRTVVQFKLDGRGQVSDAKVLENTLNDALAKFLVEALASGAPYVAWPTDLRDHPARTMTCTFYLD